MLNFYEEMDKVIRDGRRVLLARIIKHAGSVPRTTGAKCLILEDGSIRGTIGGGLLEYQVTEKAKQVFKDGKSVTLHFTLTGDEVGKQGIMLCGGSADVFMELFPSPNTEENELFRNLQRIVLEKGRAVFLTLIAEGNVPETIRRHALITPDGSLLGAIGTMTDEQEQKLRSFLQIKKPELRKIDATGTIIFAEPIEPLDVLYIFGAGHISTCIVPIAKMAGFQVVVIDDRAEFMDRERFPLADELMTIPFSEAFSNISVTGSSYLVIVTRGHIHDLLILRDSLKTSPAYIGMIGSKRKRDMIYTSLVDEGFTRERLLNVHSPIGLAIDAETPEEIAVSIVAELIHARARNKGK